MGRIFKSVFKFWTSSSGIATLNWDNAASEEMGCGGLAKSGGDILDELWDDVRRAVGDGAGHTVVL